MQGLCDEKREAAFSVALEYPPLVFLKVCDFKSKIFRQNSCETTLEKKLWLWAVLPSVLKNKLDLMVAILI